MGTQAEGEGGLPARSHIFLSEFFTWALEGVARDDAAVKQLAKEQYDRDAKDWGHHFGPGWLIDCLKLIRDGHETYPRRDRVGNEAHDYNQQTFSAVQRWLERHGGTAEDALTEAEHEFEQRQSRDSEHHALERFLYDAASDGRLIIKARKWDDAKECAASEYESIPADFFLRACRFGYSEFHGRSELFRWTDDDSPDWLHDSVFNKSDPPVAYVEAKISRADALKLKEEFIRDENRINAWNPTWLSLAASMMWAVSRDKVLTLRIEGEPDRDDNISLNISSHVSMFEVQSGLPLTRIKISEAWPAIQRLIADEKIFAEGRSVVRRVVPIRRRPPCGLVRDGFSWLRFLATGDVPWICLGMGLHVVSMWWPKRDGVGRWLRSVPSLHKPAAPA